MSLEITLAGVTYPDPAYHITRADSEVSVIEYILDGEGYVVYDGKTHHVCKDMIYFLPRGARHNYYSDSDNPFTKIFLNLSGSLCEHLPLVYGISGKHFFDGDGLKPAFEKIDSVIRSDIPESEMQAVLQGIFLEIISRLSLSVAETRYSDEALRLKNYLDSSLDRLVSTKELSRVIFRSQDYCQKLFKRELGVTPYAYQLERKMQIAKSLLADTQMSVGEIAQKLGYNDIHYFSNLFQKKCGCRPLTYRKSRR
ncbi:MAG: helix-turn-helix domain-containing protein [Clostridia bacterium]|nr:helix-turn-helix domain-containing protein [Clostridia bacterium]